MAKNNDRNRNQKNGGGNRGGKQSSGGNQSRGNSGSQGSNRSGGQGDFALDNLTYNIITVLHEKSKGLEAFDKYLQDARGEEEIVQIFEQMRQDDQRHIQRLQEALRLQLGSGGEISGEEIEEEEDAA